MCQYDVINHGKDGIGAVSSSGQGSLWRIEALKGQQPDGTVVVDPKNLNLVGKKLGFRSEMLIEDTHTSIELFRQVSLFILFVSDVIFAERHFFLSTIILIMRHAVKVGRDDHCVFQHIREYGLHVACVGVTFTPCCAKVSRYPDSVF